MVKHQVRLETVPLSKNELLFIIKTRFPLLLGVLLGYKVLYDKMGIKQILKRLEKEVISEGGKKYAGPDFWSSISGELAESQLEEASISIQAAEDDLKAERCSRAVFNSQQCVELAIDAALNGTG